DDGWSDLGVVIARPSTIWERANVVVDAWSRKGRVKSTRVQDICKTIQAKWKKGRWWFILLDRIWILMVGNVRTLFMEGAYATKYSIHPVVKDEYQRSSGLLLQPEIPDCKREKERLIMDSKSKLPRLSSGCDATDGQSERTFRTLENMFRACVRNLVVVGILTFREAEIGESKMIGLELEQDTIKVFVIKERLKEAKDRQEIKTNSHLQFPEGRKVHIRVLIDFDATFDFIDEIECVLRVFGLHIMRLIASLQLHGGSDLLTLLVCITSASSGKKGTPPSMCQTLSNIDAHVEGEQFHESKQLRVIRMVRLGVSFHDPSRTGGVFPGTIL
nr:hypothetical protein [Tanacetum cinerariifolium]